VEGEFLTGPTFVDDYGQAHPTYPGLEFWAGGVFSENAEDALKSLNVETRHTGRWAASQAAVRAQVAAKAKAAIWPKVPAVLDRYETALLRSLTMGSALRTAATQWQQVADDQDRLATEIATKLKEISGDWWTGDRAAQTQAHLANFLLGHQELAAEAKNTVGYLNQEAQAADGLHTRALDLAFEFIGQVHDRQQLRESGEAAAYVVTDQRTMDGMANLVHRDLADRLTKLEADLATFWQQAAPIDTDSTGNGRQ
jgi:hypothetical protein